MQTKRRGILPLILGLLLMFVGAPALLIGGAVYGVKGLVKVAEEAPVHQPGDTVTLTKDQPVLVLVDTGPASGTSIQSQATTQQTCTIAGPDGATLSAGNEVKGLVANFDGRRWESAGSYDVTTSGDYAFTCAGPTKIFTGEDAQKFGGSSVLAILGGVFGSLLVGLIGLILTIVGIVKLVRSGRERRMGGGYGGYGGPGPYAGAPAPQQPYGTPPQQQGAYAVPPPPAGSTSGSAYGSTPPSTTGAGPYGTTPPAYDTTPIPQTPPTTPAGPVGPADGITPPPAGRGTPPPPPPAEGPTYRDPTA